MTNSRTISIFFPGMFVVETICREIIFLLWNDIELSWKLHLVKYLFQIFTYKYGIVVTF